ncbi:uncharacterized protein JCM6883_002817 [Sporobolomyces salmoneus]|uniref:uncharacterized protein n=1 Tax=Sporobolomyces salmoneus TaxID=183962 RepID=UPI00318296F8
MSSDLPSPTKRPSFGSPPEAPPRDPTDIRGSMSKQAQTGFEYEISHRATQARHAVAQGHILPTHSSLRTRRPLGISQTEPVLSFAQNPSSSSPSFNSPFPPSSSSSRFPLFQTTQDIKNLVYTDGKRPDELRPFGETSTSDYGGFGSRTNSLSAFSEGGAGATGGDADGDGFDLDDVYGKSSFTFPSSSQSAGAGGEDSQGSNRTVTQRMKRAFVEAEDSGSTLVEEGGGEDEDMVATDVEDEGEGEEKDQVASSMTNMFGGPMKTDRKIAGAKRAFGKTQSLPASAFSGMDF